MSCYKLIKNVDIPEFQIRYELSKPRLSNCIIFQGTYSLLNELIQEINHIGTKTFISENKNIINYIDNTDFETLKSLITKYSKEKNTASLKLEKQILEFINIKDETLFDNFKNKWYFIDYSTSNLFRKEVESKKQSISSAVDNLTYIYSHDLVMSDILELFDCIKKSNSSNVCIKLLTITSTTLFDISDLINYIYDDTYIFKPTQDSQIKDTWYILGKGCQQIKLDSIIAKIGKNKIKNMNISQILRNDNLNINRDIYNKFTKDIIKNITPNIMKFIK